VLNLSDGEHSLLDVAERSGLPFELLVDAANALLDVGLLARCEMESDAACDPAGPGGTHRWRKR
jgi:winged helix-turn-helix protein